MCKKFYYYNSIILLLVFVNENNCKKCVRSFADPMSAELHLDKSFYAFSENTFKECPVNITRLKIISVMKNVSIIFSNDLLYYGYLSKIHHLEIYVNELKFLKTHHTIINIPKLVSLRISNCEILTLPFGFLYGLNNLRFLYLKNNHLDTLPADFLIYTPNLKFLDLSHNSFVTLPFVSNTTIDVSVNPIKCTCFNSWIYQHSNYVNLDCLSWPSPCEPKYTTNIYIENANNNTVLFDNLNYVTALPGSRLSIICDLNSVIPSTILWVSPIGIISTPFGDSNETKFTYTHYVQPLIRPSFINISFKKSISKIDIENVRGYMSGDWECIAMSTYKISRSIISLKVISSVYKLNVYYSSLIFGWTGMAILLSLGVIGGTIRYCNETHCLKRPQPSSAYKGKTYIGVIPVPEVSEDFHTSKQEKNDGNTNFKTFSPPDYDELSNKDASNWFCSSCGGIYYLENPKDINLENLVKVIDLPTMEHTLDENLDDFKPHQKSLTPKNQPCETEAEVLESHRLLMSKSDSKKSENQLIVKNSQASIVKKYRDPSHNECLQCCHIQKDPHKYFLHYLPRPGSADVKLIVSNDKLAEEYLEALTGLAQAVDNPDPTHFRERLEEFRTRLSRDVGHRVKILRGEFRGLKDRSVKSVSSLKNQSSVAAQRVRASFSYGVEQVKDGMRSMAELCGALGTIGQTISVVSVYIDKNDQTKKEKFISDFIF